MLGLYESIAVFEEGEILGIAPSDSLVHHDDELPNAEDEGEEGVLTSLAVLADPHRELSCR